MNLLERMWFPDARTRFSNYPHELSGGMRQRVVGAIALARTPSVLIADEPTTALDATVQAQYLRLLQDIQRQTELSVLFITHDLGIVANLCHRVAVMYMGRIVEIGGVRTIFDRPRHPYTQGLLASVPRLEERVDRLKAIPGQPTMSHGLSPGCAFAPRCGSVLGRCRVEYPPTVDVAGDHAVACWLVEQP